MPKLSDVEWIYVVLAIFYAIELLTWIRPGVHAFASRWGSFHGRHDVWRLTGNENGSLILGGLTPSDGFLLTDPDPLDEDHAWHRSRFDIQDARDRIDQWSASTAFIRRFAWLLLTWIGPVGIGLYYGLLPITVDDAVTYGYLLVLLIIWWTTAVLIFLAHRRLFPNDKAGRFKLAAYTFISPVVPLRGADYLSRGLVCDFHPVTVSAAIDDKTRFRDFAARCLRDVHFGNDQSGDGLETRIREVIQQCEFNPDELLAPPERDDADSLNYCPRCHQQFEVADATCDQCDGCHTIAF